MVGTISLRPFQGHKEIAELGYMVSEKHWGKGIATQAVKRIQQIAKTEHKIIGLISTTHPQNIGSQQVLKKSGFRLVGELEKYMKVGQEIQPRYLFYKSLS